MFMTVSFPFVSILALALQGGADEPRTAVEPTSRYKPRTIEGWTVLVHPKLLDDAELAGATLDLLKFQLFQITRVVPAPALAKIRRVRIWVEVEEPHTPCMAYHPSADWLREHGMNPDKARCVELANARTFLEWTKHQPWMVLHELAHAYHDQFLDGGHAHKELRDAQARAVAAGLYGEVLYYNGQTRSHYAATNAMEYFAEASEAYFGTNDFYPFVRAELRTYDPATLDLVRRLWGEP